MASRPPAVSPLTPLATPPVADTLAQLHRLLASPHFRSSRRCSALLQHVVTAAIDRRPEHLKERVIGAEVFGREPDYDTNQDAVVRNAAAEVRKRLAQYYLESGHEEELRIDLPAGSYLPEFHPPAPRPAPPLPPRHARRWLTAAALVAAGLGAGLVLPRLSRHSPPQPTALDLFWAPVAAAPGDAQILLGQSRGFSYIRSIPTRPNGEPDLPASVPSTELQPMRDRFFWIGDSFCLARINAAIAARGKSSRFRGSAVTPYSEVRGHAAVLIGYFNNAWTERLTRGLRYSLGKNGVLPQGVRDAQAQGEFRWKVQRDAQGWLGEEDYAIVSRFFSPQTEQIVVAAGGIGHFGTMAAGDFISNDAYFREAVRTAPAGWEGRNMQFVLRVRIADGSPSPPEVLAAHFW